MAIAGPGVADGMFRLARTLAGALGPANERQ